MRFKIFISMALRFLGFGSVKTKSNARKSLLGAMFGIGISIIPLIIVLVVSDGMIEGITSRSIELGSSHMKLINMHVKSNIKSCEIEKELKENIKENLQNNFFVNAWIERQGNGLLVGSTGRSGATIRAIEPSFFLENKSVSKLLKVKSGSLDFPNNKSAIIGQKIAKQLDLKVGDSCKLINMYRTKSGKSIPKVSRYKVTGIVSSGYEELDALWVFIPLEAGIKIMDLYSSITSILINTKDPFNEEEMKKLRYEFDMIMPDTFYSYTWMDFNRSAFVYFKTTKNILMFIMFLIALVASANISSAIVMLVMERRREIAILKATGAHPSLISFSFIFAGFLTGLAGLLFGMPLGILAALNVNAIFAFIEKVLNYMQNFFYALSGGANKALEIHILDPAYYLEEIPIVLNFTELYMIAISMLLLSVIVCIIPAVKAGREKPIDIMRKI